MIPPCRWPGDLIAEHPNVSARLLIGNERVSDNPKLNNMVKGWYAANHPWIVMADSNVLMPPDYLHAVISAWREDTGLVCAPPVGAYPANFAAEFECAFLNTYQASWQYAADSARFGFAQGKTMLWRRDTLDKPAASCARAEFAEDAAATKIVRRAGLRVTLSEGPSVQPLGVRQIGHVWSRQVRWARLRRASFPLLFAPEIFTGAALPMFCAAAACGSRAISIPRRLWRACRYLVRHRGAGGVGCRLASVLALAFGVGTA